MMDLWDGVDSWDSWNTMDSMDSRDLIELMDSMDSMDSINATRDSIFWYGTILILLNIMVLTERFHSI